MNCPRCHSSLVKKLAEEPLHTDDKPFRMHSHLQAEIRRNMLCENCTLAFTVEERKRWLGTFWQPDGKMVEITENTPVDVLLDVIESLSEQLKREQTHHRGLVGLLASPRRG